MVDLDILESRVGVARSVPIDSAIVEIHSLILFFLNLRNIFNMCAGLGHCKFITDIASVRENAAHFNHVEAYGSLSSPFFVFVMHIVASTKQFFTYALKICSFLFLIFDKSV